MNSDRQFNININHNHLLLPHNAQHLIPASSRLTALIHIKFTELQHQSQCSPPVGRKPSASQPSCSHSQAAKSSQPAPTVPDGPLKNSPNTSLSTTPPVGLAWKSSYSAPSTPMNSLPPNPKEGSKLEPEVASGRVIAPVDALAVKLLSRPALDAVFASVLPTSISTVVGCGGSARGTLTLLLITTLSPGAAELSFITRVLRVARRRLAMTLLALRLLFSTRVASGHHA